MMIPNVMIWGRDDLLLQVTKRIYANFHKPSWQTLRRHLFPVGTPKKLLRRIKSISRNGEKGDSKQERMFGRAGKIPIANTSNELVGVDFVDYGDLATFLHIRDNFSRFSAIVFLGTKKEERTAEMVRESAISNRMAVFGTPGITAVGKDSRFTGGLSRFPNARNIVLQSVIPGSRQSLGAAERRHGLFRTIIDRAIGNKRPMNLSNKEWKAFAEMATMRLNPQVRQCDGSAPGKRGFGRTPKMPIGTIDNPFLKILRTQWKHPRRKTMCYLARFTK